MKVLVCGGRDFADKQAVYAALDRVHDKRGIAMLINGGAPGADSLAADWASDRRIHCATVPALWKRQDGSTNRAAGPERNQAMLLLAPDLVIAFPGGRGTADMTGRADRNGVRVWRP